MENKMFLCSAVWLLGGASHFASAHYRLKYKNTETIWLKWIPKDVSSTVGSPKRIVNASKGILK